MNSTILSGAQIGGSLSGGEMDARTIDYDPESAQALLAEGDQPSGFRAQLLFPTGDDWLSRMAEQMVGYLAKVGIDVTLRAVPAANLRAAVNTSLQAGEPVLWLERR
jgi:ABC-type transport system substrate-binding protein